MEGRVYETVKKRQTTKREWTVATTTGLDGTYSTNCEGANVSAECIGYEKVSTTTGSDC